MNRRLAGFDRSKNLFDPPKVKKTSIGRKKSLKNQEKLIREARNRRKAYRKALLLQLSEVGYTHSLEEGGGFCTHFAIDGEGQKTPFSYFIKEPEQGMAWKRVWEDMNRVFPETKIWPFGEETAAELSSLETGNLKPKLKAKRKPRPKKEPQPSKLLPNRYELLKQEDLPPNFRRKRSAPRRRKVKRKERRV